MLPGNATARPTRARGQPGRPPVPLSRFIGRERELDAVLAALSDARTVCLTGPGGAGKTRLAIAAAERAAGRFADGVRWVDLAQVAQHASIVRALAIPLGVREVSGRALFDSIVAELAERECLLVLDNCEHVLNACRHAVRQLLAECPQLHVLVTSREVLAISGEIDFPVPPLDARESSRLFCARAAAVVPGFDPDAAGADAIARICRHLDGLPLALELAAARVRVLSVAEIADALEDRLAEFVASDPSTTDRHRTLRATLDWSFRLLTDAERRLLLELSVFRGGFTLDAARAVHAGDGDEPGVLELVSRLVDRSLVTATRQPMGGTRTRYALLETVRLYAADLLDQSGDAARTRSRHAEFFVAFAESVEPELSGVGQREWLDLIELERGNLGAALRWSAQGGGARVDGLRLTAALWRFCYLRGYYTEGRRWSDQTLAAAPDAPPALRARALTAAGSLAFLQCAYRAATHRLDEALRLDRELGDERGIAGVLQTLGSVARERGEYPTSRRLHEDSLARWRALDDTDGSARSLNYLSLLAWLQGDLGRAAELAGEAADLFRALGDGEGVAWSLLNLGAAALYDGRHDQAQALLAESLSRSIT
ncbi:MAG TPA: tetratricopeptide repeat protein, partial [Jatrophihabitantaceae bacterium]